MFKVATVSYLNARPLVDGLEAAPDVEVVMAVPSRLLEALESDAADLALCPVIDYQRSSVELEIVPVGAIGCDGPALTVKLFCRRSLDTIEEVAVDPESHTSVALLGVLLHDVLGRRPVLRTLSPGAAITDTQAVLLIGDKVVTDAPASSVFPHQLDLGQAWHELAGVPFVFATWMTRRGRDLGDLPERIERLRRDNGHRLQDIASRHAPACGWPPDLALTYLSRNLRYQLGPAELAGITEFWRRCKELGVIEENRTMRLYGE